MAAKMQPQTSQTSSNASTTASETIRTSREVLGAGSGTKEKAAGKSEPESAAASLAPSRATTSPANTLSDSRSSADIPSELFGAEQENEGETTGTLDNAAERRSKAPPSLVHGHLLPSGWACNYDPSTDEYKFEYDDSGALVGRPEQVAAGVGQPIRPKTMPSTRQDRGINVRTPTRDHTVQTSRRPTLDLFECQYGYHFPTSPTSSMISELAKQVQRSTSAAQPKQPTAPKTRQIGYGKHKLVVPSEEAEQTGRLHDMFPTAPLPIIEQMIRIYHGREGLIKAALISLGYKRSSEYNVQQATAQSPIMLMMSKPSSKKLFDKLVGYFPDKDESLIKSLMYTHKEVEHEIISALVESGHERSVSRKHVHTQLESALRADRNGAIMKLRYLKFLYPTCEEIELYHLLNCNDLNAQIVMELVEKRGHKRVNIEEVMQNRKSQAQQMRAQQAAHAAQDKATSSATDLVKAHVDRTKPTVSEARVAGLRQNIKKTLEQFDDHLIVGALEAADYNEALARKFLQEMEPADEALFTQRYEIPREIKPDVVVFPCKATQKGNTNFMSVIENESISIPREVIECETALALLKVDASTYTQEDFPCAKFTHRLGRQLALATGSTHKRKPLDVRDRIDRGPSGSLRSGSKYAQFCENDERPKPTCRATGHKTSLVQGKNLMLHCGHNPKLLQRVHPFFAKPNA